MKSYIDILKKTDKPIGIYGMGNGAEKIIFHLKAHNIGYDFVFASDGFVRGQQFLNSRVISLAEAESTYGDFIAVSGFALKDGDVEIFRALSKKHTLISPNLPPYGEGCIDENYISENQDKIERVKALLADEKSVLLFDSILKYDITGNIDDLLVFKEKPEGLYKKPGMFADVGAYNGDTALQYVSENPDYSFITAFEPSPKTFAKLKANTEGLKINCVNAAVGEKNGKCFFNTKHGRGSAISAVGTEIDMVSIDSYIKSPVSFIKIDGEGYDMDILCGGVNTIYKNSPAISCAVYHRAYDIIEIPLWLHNQNPSYRLYLRNTEYIPAFDVFVYAVSE